MCTLSNAGASTYLIHTIQELRSYLEKVAPGLADNLEDRMARAFEPEQFSVVLCALLTGLLLGDGGQRANGTGASLVFPVSAASNASALSRPCQQHEGGGICHIGVVEGSLNISMTIHTINSTSHFLSNLRLKSMSSSVVISGNI